jgi:hypothetical protein
MWCQRTLLGLSLVIALSTNLPTNSQAGGKGEAIEKLILYGLGRGAANTGRELLPEDESETKKTFPELLPRNNTKEFQFFPSPCSPDGKHMSGCGTSDDLFNALETKNSKNGQESTINSLATICDATSKSYDFRKCLQELEIKQ